jgi:hypothetical protein
MDFSYEDFYQDLSSLFNIKNHESTISLQNTINNIDEHSETNIYIENIMESSTSPEIKKIKIGNIDDLQKNTRIKFISSINNLGRKKKISTEKGKHTKYDGDNIIRKIKSIIIRILIKRINQIIYSIYKGKIGYGPFIKKLFAVNQNQIIKSKNDKDFIYKPIKDILSENITGRISNYAPDFNKATIQSLLNENDIDKKEIFKTLFNLTFIDCLNHYCGKKYEPILEGIETLEKTCDYMIENGEDEDYIKVFCHHVNNFQDIIQRKKNRNAKTKNFNKKEL